MFRIYCLIFGYFIGCIQTAYYVGKYYAKIDIREHGSGNAGTTNVARIIGFKAGLITFLADVFKAFFVYIVCSVIFKGSGSFYTYQGADGLGLLPGLYGGFGLVLGHNFPFQIKFKGGKGIASTFGIFLCMNLKVALISFSLGMIVCILSKFISLAALTVCVLIPIFAIVFKLEKEAIALVFVYSSLAFYRHKANISRLLSGTENKFTIKKKENKENEG